MYFRRQSTHAVPALKLCRSPCIWQMIKTVFLGITSSHPCFLVQCESFPSCQCCYSGLSALFFEDFPQLSSLKTPVFCGISFACRPSCVGFVQILNVDLAQEPCIDYFWLVLHSQAIFTFSPLLFYFLCSSSCRLRHCFQEGLELGVNMLESTVMLVSGTTALAYLHSYGYPWFFLSCQERESVGSTSTALSLHLALKPRVSYHFLHQRALGKGWHWLN